MYYQASVKTTCLWALHLIKCITRPLLCFELCWHWSKEEDPFYSTPFKNWPEWCFNWSFVPMLIYSSPLDFFSATRRSVRSPHSLSLGIYVTFPPFWGLSIFRMREKKRTLCIIFSKPTVSFCVYTLLCVRNCMPCCWMRLVPNAVECVLGRYAYVSNS